MKRLLICIAAFIFLIAVSTACGAEKADGADNDKSSSAEASYSTAMSRDENSKTESQDKNPADKGRIETEGMYVGEIDNSSIEITVNGVPMAFRYDDALRPVIDKLNKDDAVKISYYKNEYNQLILVNIQNSK